MKLLAQSKLFEHKELTETGPENRTEPKRFRLSSRPTGPEIHRVYNAVFWTSPVQSLWMSLEGLNHVEEVAISWKS
jgi:hypothetical protein